jgi:hypothetical protein
MKEKNDILSKAVDSLRNKPVPPGPPEQAADAVIKKLAEAGGVPPGRTAKPAIRGIGFTKITAAAVLLIVAGYTIGRLTAPRPPDMEQLRQSLESPLKSAIREDLLEEMKKRWQLASAASYVHLKEELNRQFCSEMDRFGAQILAASGMVTNHHLAELTESVNAALRQVELNRMQDNHRLMNDLASFAYETEDELARTREEVAQFLIYTPPGRSVPNESRKPERINERRKK